MGRPARILIGLGVFMACAATSFVAAHIAAALGARPGERDPEAVREWAMMLAPTLPEGENGWPHLHRAQQEWRAIDKEMSLRHDTARALDHARERLLMDAWDHPEHEIPRLIWIEVEARVIPMIHAAAAGAVIVRTDDEFVDSETMAAALMRGPGWELSRAIHDASLLIVTTMRACYERENWPELEHCINTNIRLSRHALILGGRRGLSTQHSVLSATLAEADRFIAEGQLPIDVIERLIETVEREIGSPPDIELATKLESIRGRAEANRRFGPTGHHLTSLDRHGVGARARLRRIEVLWSPMRDEYFDERDRSLREASAWASDPTQDWSMSVHDSSVTLMQIARTDAHMIVQMRANRVLTLAAARASLAIGAFRARTGRWPRTLDEAMPHEWTMDPMTAAPFGYDLQTTEWSAPALFQSSQAPDEITVDHWYSWWMQAAQEREPLTGPWPSYLSVDW